MISKNNAIEVYQLLCNVPNRNKAVRDLAKKRKCSVESIKRYYRYGASYLMANKSVWIEVADKMVSNSKKAKKAFIDDVPMPACKVSSKREKLLDQLKDLPDEVLTAMVNSKNCINTNRPQTHKVRKPNKNFKIGFFTDPHIGSRCFRMDWFNQMVATFNEQQVDFIACSGDVTDGLYMHRPGHVFELTQQGYKSQKEYAVEVLSKLRQPLFCISGNHDRTYLKDMNADIVQDICSHLPNATYLGHDMADIMVGNIIIRLFHGEDSNSYALSYRAQKLCESFSGGDKAHILLLGHVHKTFWLPMCRNIEVFSGGALCMQSNWMASKKLENHAGFWIISVESDADGVTNVSGTWKPFFIEPIGKLQVKR